MGSLADVRAMTGGHQVISAGGPTAVALSRPMVGRLAESVVVCPTKKGGYLATEDFSRVLANAKPTENVRGASDIAGVT